ncbi:MULTISPECIES: cytochrome c biogenesis CcdA family protein [Pseudovibrio]|uniref:cytochrome c biogenesis CcdA family protein n=1 Tax=Stappiaceae TaxID=2821832 RepID=UPI00236652B6|nr:MULTISPECIES: cytochrome c biogenesis protein CcdA [Pseudovibrio]MDD7908691.1 cytochrome c biogenesis protein CcdA [Pseudovibrio exalbescens]MDX5592764.1 cytochrome c biogenesis protein CcdA [Pseudovibrio sp. SPO723]
MLEQVTILGAFLAGILSFVSPCVLPLVPPYLGYIAGMSLDELTQDEQEAARRNKVIIAAMFFVAGFSTVFVLLGASASFLGQFFLQHSQVLGYVAGGMIILMGLHFLGVFKIAFLYREARVQVNSTPAGFAGAYIMGLAFGFGWTPCIGPVLASILLIAGTEASVGNGMVLLASYALGIGVPFLIAAAFAGPFMNFMKGFRQHMQTVERVMGGLLVLTGIGFWTGYMQAFSFWLLETFPALGMIG